MSQQQHMYKNHVRSYICTHVCTYPREEVLKGLLVLLHELIHQRRLGDRAPAGDGVVVAAQVLQHACALQQHLRVGVLVDDVGHVLQQRFQVLTSRRNT